MTEFTAKTKTLIKFKKMFDAKPSIFSHKEFLRCVKYRKTIIFGVGLLDKEHDTHMNDGKEMVTVLMTVGIRIHRGGSLISSAIGR